MRTRVDIHKLVRAARNGDKEAVGILYDTYLDAVYRFVFFRVSSREDAEDISEQTFISAFEHIGRYEEKGLPFEAWIFKIARNKIIDHYRKQKPRIPIEELADLPDGKQNVEHDAERALTHTYVMDCMRRLPESYREILILTYIEEKTNEEISGLIHKPPAHIRVLKSRALHRLRALVAHD